jgi:hypothetical protein
MNMSQQQGGNVITSSQLGESMISRSMTNTNNNGNNNIGNNSSHTKTIQTNWNNPTSMTNVTTTSTSSTSGGSGGVSKGIPSASLSASGESPGGPSPPPPSSPPILAIFIVEATSRMASHYNELLTRYLIPACHQIKSYGSKKTEFALVTYGGHPRWSRRTIDRTSFTFELELMMERLSKIDYGQESPEDYAFGDALICALDVRDGQLNYG